MGSAFELILVHKDAKIARHFLTKGIEEIKRIEKLLTVFSPDSVISKLNELAGKQALSVSPEVYQLLQRCQQIATLSQGAFDISVGPLKALYNFKGKSVSFPTKKTIQASLDVVGYQHISFSDKDQSVFLQKSGMRISLAAIGKGYAADCVRKLWRNNGLEHGVINASGDLTTMGKRANGQAWQVGIAHPENRKEVLFYLPVDNMAVATSGDAEQFFTHKNKRYSHNINPATGLPAIGLKSISVFSPSAELSDALATAVYIKGVEQGIHFINQLPHTHCLLIDNNNKIYTSKNLNIRHEE